MKTQQEFKSLLQEFKQRGVIFISDTTADRARTALVSPAVSMTADLFNQVLTLSRSNAYVVISRARAAGFWLTEMNDPRRSLSKAQDSELLGLVSVEAREGVTTGISSADRSLTIELLGAPQPNPRALVRPGHVFPILAREGGVLVRTALPEAALDITTLADFSDAALYMDLLDDRGDFLQLDAAKRVANENKIPFLELEQLVSYRLQNERFVSKVAESLLPTRGAGEMRSCMFQSTLHEGDHIALVKGSWEPDEAVLVRVQPEFTFSDVFGGDTPPSRQNIQSSLEMIGARGKGVLLYLRRPQSGQLQEQIAHWPESPQTKPGLLMREYGIGAQILSELGVRKIELITNSKKNLVGLNPFGIEIVKQIPLSEGSK